MVALQPIDADKVVKRAQTAMSNEERPFLRWAGSKRRLLPQIVEHLPPSFRRYYEPFLGGGSMLFLLKPLSALISDANAELIETWSAVRDNPKLVHKWATSSPLAEETYYEVRGRRSRTAARRAGEFIYLNRGAFKRLTGRSLGTSYTSTRRT
jgi:DNA adenine methylase